MSKLNLNEVKQNASRLLGLARSMHRIVSDPRFDKAWKISTESQRASVKTWIKDLEVTELTDWLQRSLAQILEEMSIRQLRDIGKAYGIPYYSKLHKQSLITRIRKAIHDVKQAKESVKDSNSDRFTSHRLRPEDEGCTSQSRYG